MSNILRNYNITHSYVVNDIIKIINKKGSAFISDTSNREFPRLFLKNSSISKKITHKNVGDNGAGRDSNPRPSTLYPAELPAHSDIQIAKDILSHLQTKSKYNKLLIIRQIMQKMPYMPYINQV